MFHIKKLIRWIKWLCQGRQYVSYNGFNCGCCGKWIAKKFKIPKYNSLGRCADTWDLCNQCDTPKIKVVSIKASNESYMITPKFATEPNGNIPYDIEPGNEFDEVPYDKEPGDE